MRSLIFRLILLAPLLLLLVLFALSNTEIVRLGLWPTDLRVEAPLALLMLGAMGVAFLVGALTTWVAGLGARLRARRAEHDATRLRAEIQSLRGEGQSLRGGGQSVSGTILPPLASPPTQPSRSLATTR